MSREEEIQRINSKIAEIVKEDISYDELMQKYEEWADTYEKDEAIWGYKSPLIAVREVSALLDDNKNALILDVCAGTGSTGKFLYEAGYQNLDATDGSSAMLELARQKNIFKRIFQAYLGKPLDVPDNYYNAVTLFGGLLDGHVKPDCFSCFRDFIRIIKPGGFFIAGTEKTSVSESYKKKVDEALKALAEEGLWELVADKIENEGTYQEQMWIFKVK